MSDERIRGSEGRPNVRISGPYTQLMIQVENLVKSYGDVKAVDGVGFEIAAGEIYGLLGPNGAGKTTTLSMMAGLLAPDEGRIRFDGVDLAERQRIDQHVSIHGCLPLQTG